MEKRLQWVHWGLQEPCQDLCRDADRKAKAQVDMKLAQNVKNKEVLFRYMSNKQQHREDIAEQGKDTSY